MPNIWHKLNLKEQREILVYGAPESFEGAIADLAGVRVRRDISKTAAKARHVRALNRFSLQIGQDEGGQ